MPPEVRRPASSLHYGYVVLAVSVSIVTGALGFARFGYTMLLPGMVDSLRLTESQGGLIASGNFFGYLVAALILGGVAARVGPRVVISASLLVCGLAMVLTGTVGGFVPALVLRTLTGIGSGGSNVPVMGLMSSWFTRERRGMAAGLAAGGSGFGLMVTGLLIPGIMVRYGPDAGWRISWFVLGATVVVLAAAAACLLRNHPREKGLRAIGTWDADVSAATDGAGATGAAAGTAGSAPAVPGWADVYGQRLLWHLAAVFFAFGFAYSIYITFFARYLVTEVGWSKAAAGAMWALVGLLSISSGFVWGTVSDRVGRKYGLAMVFFVQGMSFLAFALARGTAGFYLSAVLFGLTAWSIPAIMAAACGDYVGPRLAPAALGFITVEFGIGQAVGPYVGGYMADATSSFTGAFLLAFALSFAGAAGSLSLRPPRSSG